MTTTPVKIGLRHDTLHVINRIAKCQRLSPDTVVAIAVREMADRIGIIIEGDTFPATKDTGYE